MHCYVHIPFCHRVCPYCKFAVSPVVNDLTKKRYLEHLKKEIKDFFKDYEGRSNDTNTLYFGGGTPSILSTRELQEIIDCFLSLQFTNSEITLEANPEDITEGKTREWKRLGINRLSLGVQSLDDTVLGAITRANTETIFSALEILNKTFENINIDLILGLPYSKPGDTLATLKNLHARFPNIIHSSIYILEEERYPKEWNDHYPSTESIEREYGEICDYMEKIGWHHYELSNWAKSGYESLHNLSYWNHSDYHGFGLSAGSYRNGRRYTNASNFRDYFIGKHDEEILTDEQIELEKIMFELRTFSLDESLIGNTGKLEQFLAEGLLEKNGGTILLTKTGIFMLDYIMSELV